MKTYFYILAEYKNQGFVISKLTDEKKARDFFVSLDSSHLMNSGKTEAEIFSRINYLDTYFIADDTKIINMRGMIFSEGKQANAYLIESDTEIIDFSKLPRVNENELFKESNNECDFPF